MTYDNYDNLATVTNDLGHQTSTVYDQVDRPVERTDARGKIVTFCTYGDPRSTPGNYEPIPEGQYDLGGIEWAGKPGDWSASWGNGLGAVWIQIHDPGGGRGAFGIHLDANRDSAPGSAGCVVFRERTTMGEFLEAFRVYKPAALVVDYGLGTVTSAPTMTAKPAAKPKQTIEVVGHSGKLRARVGSQPWFELDSFKFVGDYRP